MTIPVSITLAKAKLSELVARAEAGEEVVITRRGKPVVTLTARQPAFVPSAGRRRLGVWEHLNLDIPMSIFEPDPEDEKWIDESIFPDKRDA
jgi:prevent-host-death family protein